MRGITGRRLVIAVAALAALGAIGWGGSAWYASFSRVTTDDAYVEGTITPVSAKVSGHVVEMLVRDNQAVKRGELLFRIDPRDYEARLAQARAAVAVAEANLRAAKSELPLARDASQAQVVETRASLEATAGKHKTLEEVVRWGLLRRPPAPVVDVVVQDEYTHDVVVQYNDRIYLVYDST